MPGFPYIFPFNFGEAAIEQTEPVNVLDYLIRQQNWVRASSDQVGITDSIVLKKGLVRKFTDGLGVGDPGRVGKEILITDSVGVGVSDMIELDSGTQFVKTSIANIYDSIILVKNIDRRATDGVGVKDSFPRNVGINPGDTVGVSDSLSAVLLRGFIATEDLGITDSLNRVATAQRSYVDAVSIRDSCETGINLVALYDSVGVKDLFYVESPGVPEVDNTWIIPSESVIAVVKRESVVHSVKPESIIVAAGE